MGRMMTKPMSKQDAEIQKATELAREAMSNLVEALIAAGRKDEAAKIDGLANGIALGIAGIGFRMEPGLNKDLHDDGYDLIKRFFKF
jgi:hypothetical protein